MLAYFLSLIAIYHGFCSNKDWPLCVVVKRNNGEDGEEDGEDGELRKYKPRNDYQILIPFLPGLLVEVNSTQEVSWPMDLIRMLTTGAYIVRLANKVIPAFREERNFVLCAIFIWDDGDLRRHVLFQQPNDDRVC